MTTPTRNPRGRPRKPPEEVLVSFSLRLTAEEARKLRFLGRQWLIPRLKKVPPPP